MDMDWGNLLFSYEGRINRAKFWLAVLVYVVISIVGTVAALVSPSELLGSLINGLVSLVTFVSGIFVAIKRLHDRDKSGWWLVLFYVAPIVLAVIGGIAWMFAAMEEGGAGAGGLGFVCLAGAAAISIWAFVEFGCLRGTVGPNQYGPDPLAAEVPPSMPR
jgi:uncharacterized membrane protein YhaH (DUF805 family)